MIWNIIGALGSVATAIMLIISMLPFRSRLKIEGSIESINKTQYVLRIYNTRNTDNGIICIDFFKGSPNRESHLLNALQITEEGHYMRIPKDSAKEIYLDPSEFVDDYWRRMGNAFGKPTDKVYILIRDIKGHRYVINTGVNMDFFKAIAE